MSITRRFFSAASLGALLAPAGVRAQSAAGTGLAVVELFTSQGCSSCPPADALMGDLAKEPGVLPLTYPVEIWDYLGWKDSLAKPIFTRRQRAYAAMVAGKRVYTPQAIINGRGHCVGSDLAAIAKLKSSTAVSPAMRISLVAEGGGWNAQLSALPAPAGARMLLLPFASQRTVQIGRGENSGRTVTYTNVIRDIIDLGPVERAGQSFRITHQGVAVDKADGFALLVQLGGLETPGAVVAAACVDAAGIKV